MRLNVKNAAKNKKEWFGMKPNELITYAVAGTIVLLLVLDLWIVLTIQFDDVLPWRY